MTDDDINVKLARIESELSHLRETEGNARAYVEGVMMSFNNDLKVTTEDFNTRADRLDKIIHGDGNGIKGLLLRTSRLEDSRDGINRALWLVVGGIVSVIAWIVSRALTS